MFVWRILRVRPEIPLAINLPRHGKFFPFHSLSHNPPPSPPPASVDVQLKSCSDVICLSILSLQQGAVELRWTSYSSSKLCWTLSFRSCVILFWQAVNMSVITGMGKCGNKHSYKLIFSLNDFLISHLSNFDRVCDVYIWFSNMKEISGPQGFRNDIITGDLPQSYI
jgi:hypothetical protein